jgi:hypothetical protein
MCQLSKMILFDNKKRKKDFLHLYVIAALIIVPALTLSCNSDKHIEPSSTTPQHEPYFPVQTEKPETYLLALLPGKLVMDKNGYLRIANALVLWPYRYSFSVEGADIWILDDKGVKVAYVGDEVKIGGGFIPDNVVPMKIGHYLPADYEGPFWLAAPMSE